MYSSIYDLKKNQELSTDIKIWSDGVCKYWDLNRGQQGRSRLESIADAQEWLISNYSRLAGSYLQIHYNFNGYVKAKTIHTYQDINIPHEGLMDLRVPYKL